MSEVVGLQVTLSQEDIRLATEEGRRRWQRAARYNWQATAGQDLDNKGHEKAHQLGAAGEIAFCRWAGLPWTDNINSFKGPDIGPFFQVRTGSDPTSRLIIRPEDNNEEIFVLVTREAPATFEIKGWITGGEGKAAPWKFSPGNRPAAFFVPQIELYDPWLLLALVPEI